MDTLIQKKIEKINQKLFSLSEKVISAINDSVEVLVEQNLERAKEIRMEDKQINALRWEIEEDCINLIATMQPVASDLREIMALLTINTELERIGDYAAGIAKITNLIGKEKHVKPLIDIPKMAELAVDMLENSIKSFVNRNENAARNIYNQDDDIDDLYNQIYRELLSYMIEKPQNITQCTHLLWVAHNIERIGDRVTNICERVVYFTSGELDEEL